MLLNITDNWFLEKENDLIDVILELSKETMPRQLLETEFNEAATRLGNHKMNELLQPYQQKQIEVSEAEMQRMQETTLKFIQTSTLSKSMYFGLVSDDNKGYILGSDMGNDTIKLLGSDVDKKPVLRADFSYNMKDGSLKNITYKAGNMNKQDLQHMQKEWMRDICENVAYALGKK